MVCLDHLEDMKCYHLDNKYCWIVLRKFKISVTKPWISLWLLVRVLTFLNISSSIESQCGLMHNVNSVNKLLNSQLPMFERANENNYSFDSGSNCKICASEGRRGRNSISQRTNKIRSNSAFVRYPILISPSPPSSFVN